MVVPPIENKRDRAYPNDITKYFYLLPLNENQRKELYDEIMEEYKNNPDSDKLKVYV